MNEKIRELQREFVDLVRARRRQEERMAEILDEIENLERAL